MAWRRSRVRIPYAPLTKKQGNPPETASFPVFSYSIGKKIPLWQMKNALWRCMMQHEMQHERRKISAACPGFLRSIFQTLPISTSFAPAYFSNAAFA